MIKISCKEYAANLKEEIKELCEKLPRQRCLTVIQIGNDTASNSYVNGKRKHPQIEVVKQMAVVPDIINYWMPMFEATKIMFNEDCEKEYIITVPSGTISNDGTYNIDME